MMGEALLLEVLAAGCEVVVREAGEGLESSVIADGGKSRIRG